MATRRTVLVVNLVLSLFFLMNVVFIWAGYSIYPSQWHFVLFASAILGNLLWLLIPVIFTRHSSGPFRLARAVLAPFWVFWNLLIFLYSSFMVLLVVLWALAFAWRWVPFTSFAIIPSTVFLGLIGAVTLWGLFQNLFTLKLEHVRVPIPGLPKEFDGFRIAMVSDLHVGLFSRRSRLKQFARAAQGAKPDLFVVCGDITDDDPIYLPKYLESLEVLDPYLPAIGVLGNHDVYADPEKTLHVLEDSRLQMLVNEGMTIERGKAKLWLAGVGDAGARRIGKWGSMAPDFDKALEGKPEGAPVVLLCHQPQGFQEALKRNVQLTLSGHTHGGQVGFKSLDWSLAKLFMEYHMGLFKEGESHLYVTPGTGYWALPVRFGISPEVSLIELQVPAQ
ncbi:MAG TPA: metallophosphoesterase [bacterium]|nr:metallophosphoesterase [bacterium]